MSAGRTNHLSDAIYQMLAASQPFAEYQAAFRSATGLPMRLVGADPNTWKINTDNNHNQSRFCELINTCSTACDACVKVNRDLMHQSQVDGPTSCNCFAGLSATSIPVYLGTIIVGYLKTGQVFQKIPTLADFETAMKSVSDRNFTPEQIEALKKPISRPPPSAPNATRA